MMQRIRGEEPVSALCRREGIQSNVYYRWLKDFMEPGKQRLKGDALREAARTRFRLPRPRIRQLADGQARALYRSTVEKAGAPGVGLNSLPEKSH